MGTFHHDKGELHGITVVVDTKGSKVFVGRCDTVVEQGVILLDGDVHDCEVPNADGAIVSKDDYLAKASKWGVWKRYDRFLVPADDVASVRPLGSL